MPRARRRFKSARRLHFPSLDRGTASQALIVLVSGGSLVLFWLVRSLQASTQAMTCATLHCRSRGIDQYTAARARMSSRAASSLSEGDVITMSTSSRIWSVRAVAATVLSLGVVCFFVGVSVSQYVLVTVGFVVSLLALAAALSSSMIANLIERRAELMVRGGAAIVLAIAVFLFSLGTGTHSELPAISGFALAMAGVAAALKPGPLARAITRRKRA